jgi:hypothetical protein
MQTTIFYIIITTISIAAATIRLVIATACATGLRFPKGEDRHNGLFYWKVLTRLLVRISSELWSVWKLQIGL